MKVVCVERLFYGNITVGKVYDVIATSIGDLTERDDYFIPNGRICIISDIGEEFEYLKKCFKYLSEVREEKLNGLGIK